MLHFSCVRPEGKQLETATDSSSLHLAIVDSVVLKPIDTVVPTVFDANGRDTTAQAMSRFFQFDSSLFTTLQKHPPSFNTKSIEQANRYLRANKYQSVKIGDTILKNQELLLTNFRIYNDLKDAKLSENYWALQLNGDDNKGNVLFTSYYLPIIKVSKKPTQEYKYPIYRYFGRCTYSREQIDYGGVLNGKGLEIAYAKHLFDVYNLQVQGSGYLEYPDGSQVLLSFGGTNHHPYKSIGNVLIEMGEFQPESMTNQKIRLWMEEHPDEAKSIVCQNPSYVFFRPSKYLIGAAGVDLVPEYSIAADPTYFPIGSTVVLQLPVLDENYTFVRHEYKIASVLDVGSAIKGAGHLDYFAGVGPKAMKVSNGMRHYGKIWLLLKK